MAWETIVYEREYENGEKQIYSVKPDGTEERCIIDSNAMDWLKALIPIAIRLNSNC